MSRTRMIARAARLASVLFLGVAVAHGQTFGPDFVADYSFTDLGHNAGVPSPYGGINFKLGDPDTLLLGGAANNPAGVIMEVGITRSPSTNQIDGYAGSPVQHATAPNIDGGLVFGPTDVLFFTTYNNNMMGQLIPGSTSPDRMIDLTALGISSSVGACMFVPPGFPGAGSLKIVSYNTGDWYDCGVSPDGAGTYDITNVTLTAPGLYGGPEGVVYIRAGNPGFPNDSVLISEWSAGSVGAYEIDADGDPIAATRRDFLSSLSGAEGAVIDPITGDFVFSTFGGGDRVLVVHGFTAPQVYCTPKTNSLGCVPHISFSGLPTMTGSDDFFIDAADITNNSFGILMWGRAPDNTPMWGGTLCVAGPAYLYPPLNAGGTPGPEAVDCTGSFSFHFSQGLMASLGLVPGDLVFTQFIHRDPGFPPPDGIGLTDGLNFTIGP